MTLTEIKEAVESGKIVCCATPAYRVIKDSIGQWLIRCETNGYTVGLTWADGVTMNERPETFFVSPFACETRKKRKGDTK